MSGPCDPSGLVPTRLCCGSPCSACLRVAVHLACYWPFTGLGYPAAPIITNTFTTSNCTRSLHTPTPQTPHSTPSPIRSTFAHRLLLYVHTQPVLNKYSHSLCPQYPRFTHSKGTPRPANPMSVPADYGFSIHLIG